jgi:hypothetical protein
MILRDQENSEKSLKERVPMHCLQHKAEEVKSQNTPNATRGCMENASLNTGANCKRYVCTVLHNMM